MEMGSERQRRPHAVLVPYPAQGHITPFVQLGKLLHARGFFITFVNTEFNHRRLLRSRGPRSLDGLPDFRFETIPDGLPYSDADATQDIEALCNSLPRNSGRPFRDLLAKLNSDRQGQEGRPKVSCVVSDGCMCFTTDAAEEFGIPEVLFWPPSASAVMCIHHCRQFIEKGLLPLKDESCFTNGYLDKPVDWIPGMEGIRLKDAPNTMLTTNPNDIMLTLALEVIERTPRAKAIIINTFYDFERNVLDAMAAPSMLLPPIFTIGPLSNLTCNLPPPLKSLGSNLWKEDRSCLEWLDGKEPRSVVYVNYGSITVMSEKKLQEFAWGLAGSGYPFLWIVRPDLVKGEAAVLPPEFVTAIRGRGMLASWCPQDEVLKHPSVGAFLTHCGWNSVLESVCGGVPLICWPFFADQQTNCWHVCTQCGIGVELEGDVRREEVEGLVRETMEGEKGEEIRRRAAEWRDKAETATGAGGSSYRNLDNLIDLLSSFSEKKTGD